jgi:hypothetical protein
MKTATPLIPGGRFKKTERATLRVQNPIDDIVLPRVIPDF